MVESLEENYFPKKHRGSEYDGSRYDHRNRFKLKENTVEEDRTLMGEYESIAYDP